MNMPHDDPFYKEKGENYKREIFAEKMPKLILCHDFDAIISLLQYELEKAIENLEYPKPDIQTFENCFS